MYNPPPHFGSARGRGEWFPRALGLMSADACGNSTPSPPPPTSGARCPCRPSPFPPLPQARSLPAARAHARLLEPPDPSRGARNRSAAPAAGRGWAERPREWESGRRRRAAEAPPLQNGGGDELEGSGSPDPGGGAERPGGRSRLRLRRSEGVPGVARG